MGDRANIVIDDNGSRVFLYTHWSGLELPEILRAALARRARWDDPQYLSRIVFQQMVGTDRGETGFGISAVCGDNSYPLLIVDCAKQQVRLEATDDSKLRGKAIDLSFDNYVALPEAAWGNLDSGRASE